MLIVHPPLARSCEPPAALAHLAGALQRNGLPCRIVDMNIEGILSLLSSRVEANDTWSRRAVRNIQDNLEHIRQRQVYASRDRYQRTVQDINRLLAIVGKQYGIVLSLANYQDSVLSPTNSDDLIKAAEHSADNIFFAYFSKRLTDLLAEEMPSCIGISLNYLGQANCAFAIIGFLKKHWPDIPIIMGGGLITTWMRSPTWRNPFAGLIDLLIAGPGEEPLLTYLGGGIPEDKALPDYRQLRDLPYLAPGFILPYAASSGCYWKKCAFCPETSEKSPYRPLSSQQVNAELSHLTAATAPGLLHFLDNAISPTIMEELIIRPPGPEWYGFARISRHLTDPDFCRGLRRSGCVMLKLGIESGSQKVLDNMGKGINLQQVAKALEVLHGVGIATYVYLLFGTPSESLAEAHETLEFARRHHQEITFLNLAIFNLPVGSIEAESLEITDRHQGDLSLYHDFRHPRGWNRRQIRHFLSTEFKRDPRILPILQRDPPVFTSNHAAFFV